MTTYYKTEQGLQALQTRSISLNARQRRALILIGTEDFALMNDTLKQRLAPPELVHELFHLGLIHASSNNNLTEESAQAESITETKTHTIESEIQYNVTSKTTTDRVAEPIERLHKNADILIAAAQDEIALTALSFEEIKDTMVNSLQQYCGLMAKAHIQAILHAADIQRLKRCQMQWITLLQESRIQPQQLNQILKQINYSLEQLHRHYS